MRTDRYQAMFERASNPLNDAKGGGRKANCHPAIDMTDWPTFDQVSETIKDLTQTHERIEELQIRLRNWGVID